MKKRSVFKQVFEVVFPIFNLALAGTIIYLAMRGDEIGSIGGIKVNWEFIAPIIVTLLFVIFIESMRRQIVIYAITKRFDPFLCLRVYLLKKHYDLLTPFHTGGKAYEFYYLHKHGFTPGQITSIPISDYILDRIGSQLTMGAIFLSLIWRLDGLDGGMVVASAIWIGLAFQIVVTVGALVICFNRVIPQKLCQLGLFLLHKVRIVKDHEKAKTAVNGTLAEYRQTVKILARKPFVALSAILLRSVAVFCNFFIIVYIYAFLFGWDWSVIPLLLLGIVLTENAGGLMPIPGGTGAMELFFLSIFATMFGTPQIILAVVMWKITSYIIPILNGIPVVIYDAIRFRFKREPDKIEA